MSVQVLRFAAALYAAGAAAYILAFARPGKTRPARVGYVLVTLAFVFHAVAIGLSCREAGGGEFFTLRGGFGFLAWIGAGAFLGLLRFWRIPAIGAFLLPLLLMALVPGVFELGPEVRSVPEVVREPVLQVHVSTAFGSVAIFGIAAVVGVMYLLQDRELKGKRFGALFPRLPSLNALDKLGQALIAVGFAVYTVPLVTGALMARDAWGSFWTWDPQQIVTCVLWLTYGVTLHLRRSGLHGRNYALVTLVAFVVLLGSWVGLGAVFPGFTRHGGTFQ